MIAPTLAADPLDRFEVVPDPDAEPADVERFLDAVDRIVERRISQRRYKGVDSLDVQQGGRGHE